MVLLEKFTGTWKITGTAAPSSIGLYLKKKKFAFAFFWMLEKIVWAEVVVESMRLYQESF